MLDRGAVPVDAPGPHWMVVDEEKDFGPVASPDGKKTAFVRDNDLWVRDAETGRETRLNTDGTIGNYYSS